MVARPLVETARNTMLFSEIVTLAVDSFRTSKWRFALTALGMVIGTASLIVVVTIGLTLEGRAAGSAGNSGSLADD